MVRNKIRYLILGMVAIIGCHSQNKKETRQVIIPPASAVVKKQITPSVHAITHVPDTYVILDTVVHHDTIKVVLYNHTMIRCSLNRLSDTLNAISEVRSWDESYAICNCMLPSNKWKSVNLIMNDSLLIISTTCGYMMMDGATHLYLLNRTKKSLKFAKGKNPISEYPCTVYVDLKNNILLGYYYHQIYDDESDAGDGQYSRWLISRYKISDKSFVYMGKAAVYCPKYNEGNLERDSIVRSFYKTILQNENWKRDNYDSANCQRIIVIDTIVDKDTIKVEYDNRGNIVCRVNGLCDSMDWKQTWLGYEPWRNNDYRRIIIPGNGKPRAFIVNDSVLLFTLVNAGNTADLFLFDIRKKSIARNSVNNYAEYVYADIISNLFMSYVGSDYRDHIYDDKVFGSPVRFPYEVRTYRIKKGRFSKVKSRSMNIKNAEDYFPANYSDYYRMYNVIIKHKK